ncbi:MAG: hypothetical protein HC780_09695 [Leptolyngbyaceae cyanobacterium CSU_1_3]|nr:hypothetical protein [Leptolyngbyaceae cyanobacterium CSU_1_3]
MESSVFSTLVFVAFGLLLVVTGGIAYLTIGDWRDRRVEKKKIAVSYSAGGPALYPIG